MHNCVPSHREKILGGSGAFLLTFSALSTTFQPQIHIEITLKFDILNGVLHYLTAINSKDYVLRHKSNSNVKSESYFDTLGIELGRFEFGVARDLPLMWVFWTLLHRRRRKSVSRNCALCCVQFDVEPQQAMVQGTIEIRRQDRLVHQICQDFEVESD